MHAPQNHIPPPPKKKQEKNTRKNQKKQETSAINAGKKRPTKKSRKKKNKERKDRVVELKNDYALGFIICEIFTVIALQDWADWGIFAVILGYPRRAHSDSQHLEAHPELQDWLQSELFTV